MAALKLNLNLAAIQKMAVRIDAPQGTIEQGYIGPKGVGYKEPEPIKQSEVCNVTQDVSNNYTTFVSGSTTPSLESITSTNSSTANSFILERLAQLQQDLQQATPNISGCLREIHRALLTDPEQVTLLTNEQRAVFFQGLSKHTNTVITTAASKSRQSSKKEFASMSLDDLL
jgi:hypothetical protein